MKLCALFRSVLTKCLHGSGMEVGIYAKSNKDSWALCLSGLD